METDVSTAHQKRRNRGTRGKGRKINQPKQFIRKGAKNDISDEIRSSEISATKVEKNQIFSRKSEFVRPWDPVAVDKRELAWRILFFKRHPKKSNLIPLINPAHRSQAIKFMTQEIQDAKYKKFIGVKLEILLAEAGIRIKKDLNDFGSHFSQNLLLSRLKGIRQKCGLNHVPSDVESQAIPKLCVNLFLRQIYIRYFPIKLIGQENQRSLFRIFPKLLEKSFSTEIDLYFFTYYMRPEKAAWLAGLSQNEMKETFGRLGSSL